MRFQWKAYGEQNRDIAEAWMDAEAKRQTGCDDGWFDYVDYMMHEDYIRTESNFFCRVVCDGDVPFAAAALFVSDDGILFVSEFLVSPAYRGRGFGTAVLKELLGCSAEIIGVRISEARAVIFPGNPASKRAFEKAGFRYESTHPDGDAEYYVYREAEVPL